MTTDPSLDAASFSCPAEASWVVARDFVAVRVDLADEGFQADASEPLGEVAPRLTRFALEADEPVRVAIPR